MHGAIASNGIRTWGTDDFAVTFGEAMVELSAIDGDSCRIGVAGDTYNTAVYLARAGVRTAFATGLGTDRMSDLIHERIVAEGIAPGLVLRARGSPGLYAISVDAHGERSFTYWRDNSMACAFFRIDGIEGALAELAKARLLYLSGITLSLFEAEDRERACDVAKAVHDAGGIVAFDSNYRPGRWQSPEIARDAFAAIAPYVTIALPTFDDESALYGDTCAEQTAERWIAVGTDEIVVKQGPRGAFLGPHGWVAPPVEVQPVDTTGAGDSFNGAYLAARLHGSSPAEAALAGHRLAAKVLMSPGAILPDERAPWIPTSVAK